MTTENFDPENELNCDWLAMRYVGDEMTAAERSQFEALLAENQEAREAVAAAVLMFAAVPLALADSTERQTTARAMPVVSSEPPAWMRRIGWAAFGAAACLAGVLAIGSFHHLPVAGNRGIAVAGKDRGTQAMGDLALHWTFLAAQTDAFAADSNPDAGSSEASTDEIAAVDTSSNRESNESIDELEAPSWLLAAMTPPPTVGPTSHHRPATE